MSKLSIYVMAHKIFEEPNDPVYLPLQVGAALHEDLGYLRDDKGDNISSKNPNYCELTGLYWVWKNDYKSDYIGLCHYRRYFLDGEGNRLSGDIIKSTFKQNEKIHGDFVIVSPKALSTDGSTAREFYIKSGHNAADLDATREVISRLYPAYLPVFDEVLSSRGTYFANMMICKKSLADRYCGWLFDILFEVEKNLDISGYDDYNRRVFGFIAERLLEVWIRKNNIPALECMVTMVDDRA